MPCIRWPGKNFWEREIQPGLRIITATGEPILSAAFKLAARTCLLNWSFMAWTVSAKHQMFPASKFLVIEACFMLVHYVIVSPLGRRFIPVKFKPGRENPVVLKFKMQATAASADCRIGFTAANSAVV